LDYANLWEDRIHVIADSGHAPFRDAREEFDPILARFLGAVLSDR
jgi:pimeloyl-ACP methyl ester carboxylesterase